MAKKKKVSKAASKNAANALLLASLQDRVTNLSSEVSRAWVLGNSREAVASKNRESVEKYAADTTASIYALRNSTQKSFTDVSTDIKKLSDSIDSILTRLGVLEYKAKLFTDKLFPSVYYLGNKINFVKNIIHVNDKEFFPLQDNILSLNLEPFGVIVNTVYGDQYVLAGGPAMSTMFVILYKKKAF
jgi:hypothetical protein